MNRTIQLVSAFLILSLMCASVAAAETADPYISRWALTIPGGGAGWLGIAEEEGKLVADLLWGGGSVVRVDKDVDKKGDTFTIERIHKIRRRNAEGKMVETGQYTETIVAKVDGNNLKCTRILPRRGRAPANRDDFTGKRIPDLPPKPDLSKAKHGKPIVLFDGTDMKKWKLTNSRQKSGWSIKAGVLDNNPAQPEGKHISYGNLRTIDEFEDFNLKLEVKIPKNGNSGVYLRGIYEVQVSDSYGRPLDSHNMGGIYSRIKPTVNAEKPAGQWQTMSLTLLDRHVTVELNGKTIIDNKPLLGCTGGALTSDEFKPGPIYLQGDHSAISYRNIVLTPIIKSQADLQKVVFEDCFDNKPAAGWKWLREDPQAWRIKNGALEIRVQPGVAHNVKNALVRRAPDRSRGKYAIDVTVTNNTVPTQQYEQAGITWYSNGKPVFKLVKELVNGELMIIPGRKPMTSKTVQLRLIVTADSFVAQFRPDAKGEFQTAATGKLKPPGDDQVSIQCYNGPPNAEHWIRFDDFRILKLPD